MKLPKVIPRLLQFFLLTALPFQAYAGLLLSKSIVTFDDPSMSRQDVTVINDSDEQPLYVSVEPYEVVAPGSIEEQLVRTDESENPGLLATPAKLIVQPGSTSLVRLLILEARGERERIYRVNFIPITKPPELEADEEDESIAKFLQISVAYQALVIVPPLEAVAKPEFSRVGKKAVFSNSGNSNYLLSKGKQCNPANPSECVDIPGKRIYPGNEWTTELPFDGPVSYSLRTLAGTKALVVP